MNSKFKAKDLSPLICGISDNLRGAGEFKDKIHSYDTILSYLKAKYLSPLIFYFGYSFTKKR